MSELLNILSSVGFNWHVALANFVNFLIILFLLHTFFFKKLGKTIKDRGEMIEQGLNKASEGERLLAKAEDEKNAIIEEAKKEGHTIVESAHKKGEELVSLMKDKAEKEANAKLEILNEKEKTLVAKVEKEFLERAPSLVAALYTTTLKKEMSEKENNAFISRIN